jgi:hypothetical protein
MQRQRSFQIIPLLRKRIRQLVSRRIIIRIVKFCRSAKDVPVRFHRHMERHGAYKDDVL